MSNDKKSEHRIRVSAFPHNGTQPRAEKWRDWVQQLETAFGEQFPLLACQLSHKPNPAEDFWGMPFHSLHDLEVMLDEEKEKLLTQFLKAQYSVLNVLTQNFAKHQKQIIASHSQTALTKTCKDNFKWEDDNNNLCWLPFGYACLHAIAAKYDDQGVTDAIAKYTHFANAKSFKPSDVPAWASTLEHAWSSWHNTVTDPSHMAAVEILRDILECDQDDWKAWALQFSLRQGSDPYTVDTLIEKVLAQDKLTHAGKSSHKPVAMLANAGRNKHVFKKPKVCIKNGCKNKVSNPRFRFCDDCFVPRSNEDAALADVPKKVRFENRERKMKQFRSKIAQLNNKRKQFDKSAFLAEATALLADAMDDNASADDHVTAAAPKKKKKKTASAEANVAEANVLALNFDQQAALGEPKPEKKKKKKKKGVLARLPGKTGLALKASKPLNKGKKAITPGQAHFATSMLDGCVTQKFAGCDLPGHFKSK